MTNVTTQPTTPTITRPPRRSNGESMLRAVLRVNALTSFVAGLILALVPDRVDDLLDTGHPGWIRVVGIAFVPFAAACLWLSNASAATLRRGVVDIAVADSIWVVASIATVLLGWYSGGGIVAVLVVAAVVDVFAVLEWIGWRRLRATH